MSIASLDLADARDTAARGVPAFHFGVVNYGEEETAAFEKAAVELNTILASDEFRQEVLAMEAGDTLGMTNLQIYSLMVEKSPLKVDLYVFNGSHHQNYEDRTEGYEEAGQPGVCHVNRFFLIGYGYCTGFIGSLMLHETLHVLGFKHYENEGKLKSVPYTMNAIYGQVAANLGLSMPGMFMWNQARADAWFEESMGD